jgi:hypothetical protein
MKQRRAAFGCLLLSAAVRAGAAEPLSAPAALSRDTVPAAGNGSAIVTVSRFGRYAIAAASAQGVAVQLVDRMAGPGDADGEPGVRDGRVDLFLDKGDYKLLTRGHRDATGAAKLSVQPFTEKNGPKPPRLVELKPVSGELRDLQQLSYWVQIEERRTVAFEAAGRSLADLRLWRDGEWLVDASPVREYVQPKVGQPLFIHRLSATLDPGLYLLTAYGGPPQPWAEGGDAQPFHLRFGIPALGEPARARFAVSPFGVDRYRVPASANYVRLELPSATAATAETGTFDDEQPFAAASQAQLEITKKSVPPVAEADLPEQKAGERYLVVRAEAGQPYVLQVFESAAWYTFDGSGTYWVSSVHSGAPADSVDATAIVVEGATAPRVRPMLEQVIEVGPGSPWSRRANLLDTLTVYFKVKEAGAYAVSSSGTTARFRVEPFLVNRPARYQPPPFRDAGAAWDLEPGLYVLTVEPVRKGIAEIGLKRATDTAATGPAVHAAVRFPKMDLQKGHYYAVYFNQQPGVRVGLVLRSIPVDLGEALPLVLAPGESVNVPVTVAEAGTVMATAEDGSAVPVAIDGGAAQASVAVRAGAHTVVVPPTTRDTTNVVLSFVPESLDPKTALPALPDAALAALPKWPLVGDGAPQFYDLEREASATFNVRAAKPGLYRLETTGLLALEGRLRTRTTTSFAQAEENGTGRNALLQQYLREGDYQVTVAARGASAGHAGLVLTRGTPVAGGFLTSGVPARASVPAGSAVSYRFNITTPGRFRVRAFGLGRTLRCRLEDTDGWPVVKPNGEADITRDFEAGRYRLVVLPERRDTRVLTVVEPVQAPRTLTGHGPHTLGLGVKRAHIWMEPEEGAPRVPDVWEWNVPAPVQARLELGADMQGELVRVDAAGARTVMAPVLPGRPWEGALDAGRYRLEAVGARRNNRLPYEVSLSARELVAGSDRAVSAPVDLELSVGEGGLVEIGSFGTADVKARLFDAEGHLVAHGDDRPDDWNFLLVESLAAGRYRLRVDPVGATQAATRVSVRIPREEPQPALGLPAAVDVILGRASRVYPITLPAKAELLVAEASSPSNVGLGLETADGGGWRSVASSFGRAPRVAVPLAGAASAPVYRLRVWSLDRRESNVRLRVGVPTLASASEAQLRKGVALTVSAGLTAGAARLTLERPGLLRLGGDAAGLWCSAPGRACEPQEGDLVAAVDRTLFVLGDAPAARATTVRAERVVLSEGGRGLTVRVRPGARVVCDLAASEGPMVLLATSQVGVPGVAFGTTASSEPRGAMMAAGAHAAVTATMNARGTTAVLWSASDTGEPFEVTLVAHRSARAAKGKVDGGRWDGALEGAQAQVVRLPEGGKRIRLTLGEGTVGAVLADGRVTSTHWNDGHPFVETLETDAVEIALLHTREVRDHASIEVLPLSGKGQALAAGAPYEVPVIEAGTLRVPVAAEMATAGLLRLHVRGADGEATFVSALGRVLRGRDLVVGADGGTLLVPHAAGWVLAWLDHGGADEGALWGSRAEGKTTAVKPPALVRLADASRLTLDLDRPQMLQLRSPAALVTRLAREGEEPRVEIHPNGTRYDAYLRAGRTTLSVRALGGEPLGGAAELTTSDVTPIGEGLGPEVILAPGATRVFAFDVARRGAVGVGVRATSEVVDAVLMNSRGERLGRGTAQMPTLDPGTYLLALQAPVDAAPVTARASLVGLKPPDVGPPEDVIRRYAAPDEESAGFSSTRIEETPRPSYRASEDGSTEATFQPEGWGGEAAEGEAGEGEGMEETTENEGGQQ